MSLIPQELQSEAAATGFPPENLYKVLRLIGLLNALPTTQGSERLERSDLDHDKLRLGFVVYGACNRLDWRSVSPADIRCD